MNELASLKEAVVLPEPALPEVFDYDASVIKSDGFRKQTGEGYRSLLEELWIARECLAVRTGRPRKVKAKGPRVPSWAEYLELVGLAQRTVYDWLAKFFPNRDTETKRSTPRLPRKSGEPARLMTPKDAAAGMKDRALGAAMEKPEWNGDPDKQPETAVPRHADIIKPVARLNADICVQVTHLRVKVSAHADKEKIQAAQKLLSELFMLFSEG